MTLDLLLARAQVENARRDFDAARTTADQAVRLASARLGETKHSYAAGQAHLQLGIALAGTGAARAARSELSRALEHLQPCVGPQGPPTLGALAALRSLGP